MIHDLSKRPFYKFSPSWKTGKWLTEEVLRRKKSKTTLPTYARSSVRFPVTRCCIFLIDNLTVLFALTCVILRSVKIQLCSDSFTIVNFLL